MLEYSGQIDSQLIYYWFAVDLPLICASSSGDRVAHSECEGREFESLPGAPVEKPVNSRVYRLLFVLCEIRKGLPYDAIWHAKV